MSQGPWETQTYSWELIPSLQGLADLGRPRKNQLRRSAKVSTMTHILPPHTDLNLAPSSLQSALQMDAQIPQQSQVQQQTPQAPARKRKKNDVNNDDTAAPSEPRRLRRSHEACARCRSKKIKASPVG